jgi:hypothetical protein
MTAEALIASPQRYVFTALNAHLLDLLNIFNFNTDVSTGRSPGYRLYLEIPWKLVISGG